MGYFKLKLVFSILLILPCFVKAQELPKIGKLSEINGDFQKINAVQKDSLGNLWIASDTHIERYNSHHSEFFNFFRGLPEGTGKINTVYIDAKNQIWVGAESGLLKYNRPKGYFEAIPSERPTTQANVQQITEDDTGALWLGCSNGIWNYSGQKVALISIFPAEQSVNNLRYVNQNIMFGTSKGFFSLNKNSIEYKKINLPGNINWNIQSLLFTGNFYLIGTQDDGLYKTNIDFSITEKIYSLPYTSQKIPISGLSMDASGNFYVATQGDGLLILDKDLRLISHFLQGENNQFSLSDNNLNGLFLDKQNTLWVSTTSGQINSINIRENNFEFIRHDPNKYSSLADNFTTAIEKDKNGNVWFGTRQGLSIWNTKNNSWQHLKNLSFTKESTIPDDIKDLHADDVHMWIATFNDGVYKVNINTFLRAQYSIDSKVKIELQKVNSLLVDSNKNVWAGGEEGDLTKIKPNGEIKSFSLKGITAMLELASGDILAAGKNGVFKIRKAKNEILPIDKLQPNAKNLPYFAINSISETYSGKIILATEGAGIVIYDAARDSYKLINKITGLPSNRIQGLIIYGKNDIWASTSKGLVNFKLEANPVIRVFDKEDGLLSAVFTRGSFAQLDDKLAFGTFKGVSIFNPEKLKNLPETAPNVMIGSVGIFSSENGLQQLSSANPEKKLNLTHEWNSISFNFFAIQPENQTELNYSWKLEGFDKEWSNPANQNNVNYANLAPGNYTFLVKGRNSYGKWSPVEEVSLYIKSPWWFTTNAYIGYALAFIILLLITFFVSRNINRRKLKVANSSVYNNVSEEVYNEKNPEVEKSVLPEINKLVPIPSESIKILIAEGNDELRKLFLETFRKFGEVHEAKDGMQAYEIAARIHPDILIADFDLPVMNGWILSEALKNNMHLMEMPVYLMFSESNESQLPQNLEDERVSFIKKPVNLDSLFQLIAAKLKMKVSLPYINTSLSERNSNLLKSDFDDEFTTKMEQLLKKNISDSSFSVEELSAAMGISSKALYLKLKTIQGITPLDYILKTKINFAKNLIDNGNSDLAEVARRSGFQNRDIFFSAYKKHFGYMPGIILRRKNDE